MTVENEVRAASTKFYSALNRMLNGDAGSLADIWSHSATVTTMHPIGGREVGWVRRLPIKDLRGEDVALFLPFVDESLP
jgi:hypothetical protein